MTYSDINWLGNQVDFLSFSFSFFFFAVLLGLEDLSSLTMD